MYQTVEEKRINPTSSRSTKEERNKKLFSVESLLNLTEVLSTLAMGVGFVLLMVACLSTL